MNREILVIDQKTIKQTCEASPSQWEAKTIDGRAVYVRYRWGCLSIGIGEDIEQAVENQLNDDDAFFYYEPPHDIVASDSVLTFEQLVNITQGFIVWDHQL